MFLDWYSRYMHLSDKFLTLCNSYNLFCDNTEPFSRVRLFVNKKK